MSKIFSLLLMAVLAALPLATFVLSPPEPGEIASLQDLESYFSENLVFGEQLESLSSNLLLQSGQRERDGVFRTEDGLVENYWPVRGGTARKENIRAIMDFTQTHDVPVCSAVVPTAAAVKQMLVPDNAPLYNQKEAISHINRAMEGTVTAADAYSALFQSYDDSREYLYYRTEPRLTSLGGYRVYSVIGERLRLSPLPLRSFSKEYIIHDYYGSLTDSWGANQVHGDILTLYRPVEPSMLYSMTVTAPDGTVSSYDTLYPTENAGKDPFSVYLGGENSCAALDIFHEEGGDSLLVLGDETAQSVVPFLAEHYSHILWCDLEHTRYSTLRELDMKNFDQVLFLYSLDTFSDSDEIQKIRVIP